MNAYDLTQDLRDLLGESTAAHWSDRLILRAICRIQQRYYMRMSMTMGDWFVKKSASLTPSAGSITLPTDCAKPVYMEEVSSGNEIAINISIRDKQRTQYPEIVAFDEYTRAYLLANTLVVNRSNYVTPVYLWYDQKCLNLHAGTAASGSGSGKIVLENSLGHSPVDDYYNGLYVDILAGTGAGAREQITDYDASTREISLTGTYSTDTKYGMVSILPPEGYDAVLQRAYANCLGKAAGVVSEEFIKAAFVEAKNAEEAFFDWVQTRIKNAQYVTLAEGI